MTDDPAAAAKYQADMDTLGALAHRMAALPLDWLARTVEVADTVGPVVYPTLYRHANLDGQRRLISAAIGVRDALAEIQAQGTGTL